MEYIPMMAILTWFSIARTMIKKFVIFQILVARQQKKKKGEAVKALPHDIRNLFSFSGS